MVATLESTPGKDTHWSRASMARRTGLSKSTIGRIWKKFDLKPHLQDSFKLSTGPFFVDKAVDVVGRTGLRCSGLPASSRSSADGSFRTPGIWYVRCTGRTGRWITPWSSGDQRVIAYTLMRKAMIATESGNSAQGLGIANSALEYKDALTPRLRAVILRQRSYSNAALGEVIASARDSDEAVIETVAGEKQGEEDRAPYCTPTYAAMEAGASWARLGHLKTALPILEKSRSEWADNTQVRDYAMCVSRLAVAYAAAGQLDQACATADEAVALAQGLGSRRVVGQLALLYRRLDRWRQDPAAANMRGRLKVLVDSFKPEREAG